MRAMDCTDESHAKVHFSGADDNDLIRQVREHIGVAHPKMSQDEAEGIVAEAAYDE